ncbi:MAG: GNAT family N-acetyltransferase [Planctomycetota bacterium]
MHLSTQVEPVPRRKRREALQFLAGGSGRDVLADVRADSLVRLLRARGGGWLWWCRRMGRLRAVAVVIPNEGRTGVVFYSSPHMPGVDADALGEAIRRASADAIADGELTLVQALIRPESRGERDALLRGGFQELAELIYLRKELEAAPSAPEQGPVSWRSWGEYDQQELAEVIAATYEDSLDCPRLAGLRDVEDTIVGHKASGNFRRDWWWIVHWAGEPAGCLLANEGRGGTAEVVYLGVVPAFRGRGLGRWMLAKVAGEAWRAQMPAVTLAVDSANSYAVDLYIREGFRETMRRLACIRTVQQVV